MYQVSRAIYREISRDIVGGREEHEAVLRACEATIERLVAAHTLLRTETRGAHMRADFPDTDAALDLHHSVSPAKGGEPVFERWT